MMLTVTRSPREKVKEFWGNTEDPDKHLQADFKDIVGSLLDHRNKASIAIKPHEFFGFLVHRKVMFTLYCGL